jgi:hypothetical protein
MSSEAIGVAYVITSSYSDGSGHKALAAFTKEPRADALLKILNETLSIGEAFKKTAVPLDLLDPPAETPPDAPPPAIKLAATAVRLALADPDMVLDLHKLEALLAGDNTVSLVDLIREPEEEPDAEATVEAIMHNVNELVLQSDEHTGESTGNLDVLRVRIEDQVRELVGLAPIQRELPLASTEACRNG